MVALVNDHKSDALKLFEPFRLTNRLDRSHDHVIAVDLVTVRLDDSDLKVRRDVVKLADSLCDQLFAVNDHESLTDHALRDHVLSNHVREDHSLARTRGENDSRTLDTLAPCAGYSVDRVSLVVP